MSLIVNLEDLKEAEVRLEGELPLEIVETEATDELIKVGKPLAYELNASLLDDALLVRGQLELPLDCECARCLIPFVHTVSLPDWTLHLPLAGDDAIETINDSVDLTPWVREDTLLGFPQHPLCAPDCSGLKTVGPEGSTAVAETEPSPSPWAQLDDWEKE